MRFILFTGIYIGYGYVSFEKFIDAVAAINAGEATVASFDANLPTVGTTFMTTAILEAGRRSLDADGGMMEIVYPDATSHIPSGITAAKRS